MWSQALILFVTTCLCEVRSNPCVLLNTCLAGQNVMWTGETPDPDNINSTLYKGYYSFLCSNQVQYANCESNNRTLVKDCSMLAGTSLIPADTNQITTIVGQTCRYSDKVVDVAVCVANETISSEITECDKAFRIQWAEIVTKIDADITEGYCSAIFPWTVCRGDQIGLVCPKDIQTALNTWAHDQKNGFCIRSGAEMSCIMNNVVIIAVTCFILLCFSYK